MKDTRSKNEQYKEKKERKKKKRGKIKLKTAAKEQKFLGKINWN